MARSLESKSLNEIAQRLAKSLTLTMSKGWWDRSAAPSTCSGLSARLELSASAP